MERPCTSRMALKLNFKGEINHNKMIQQCTGRHQEKRKYAENRIVSGSRRHQLSRHRERKAPQCLFQLNHNMAVI